MPLIRFDDDGSGGYSGPGPGWTRQPDANPGGITGQPPTFEPGNPNGSGMHPNDGREPAPPSGGRPPAPSTSPNGGTATAPPKPSTNPDGSQVGSGIPWDKGSDRPSYDPPGYHWDPTFGMFVPNGPTDTSRPKPRVKPTGGHLKDPAYVDALIAYYGDEPGVNPSVKNDPNYWRQRILSGAFGDDEGYLIKRFFQAEGAPEGGGGNQRVGIGGTLMGGGVFDDPATQQWEQVLRGLAGKMSEPYTPPGFGPLEEYLGKYFKQLQGPAYTPEQMALMNTQAIEPLTQERDAAKQRQIERFSAHGYDPGSGIAQDQSNQLDREYAQLRSQRERELAVGAIGQQNQNRQQAAQVGSQLAGLQTQLQAANEARATHGLELLHQIPALADSRLQLALGSLGQNNPNAASLLTSLQGFRQQGMDQHNQDAAYWAHVGELLTTLFLSGNT